jgi:hypothetical protein
MQNIREQALAFVQANPNSSKASIGEHLQLKGLPLFNLLKQMVKDGQIVAQGEGQDTTYTVSEATVTGPTEPEETPQANEQRTETGLAVDAEEQPGEALETKEETKIEVTDENKEEKQDKEPVIKKTAGRNTGTYKFQNTSYNKGKLIHAVVSAYCSTHGKITHDKLKEVFPDTLLTRFGIFQTVEKGREISGAKYDRYFFKEEMQIKLKDAIIVTCNQITSENIMGFLEQCAKLGLAIDAE